MERHKGPRHFQSGAAKRKTSKERAERQAKEPGQTRRMTEFFTRPFHPTTSDADSASSSIQPEQKPATDVKTAASSSVEVNQHIEETGTASKQVLPESHTNPHVDDIGLWPVHITKELIDYWTAKGPQDLHHSDVKTLDAKSAIQIVADNASRKCTPAMFERRNRND